MRQLSPREIKYHIVEESAKDIPIEEIQYNLEKDRSQQFDLDSLTAIKEELSDKIEMQKQINERRKKSDVDELVLMMKDSIRELTRLIVKLRDNEDLNADKTIIRAIQQINGLVSTLLKATGQLATQQEASISNYYVKITQINEFFEENLPDIFKSLSPEAKKRLKEQISCQS